MTLFLSGKKIICPPTDSYLVSLTNEELNELYNIANQTGKLDRESFFDSSSKLGLIERRAAVINYYFAKYFFELNKTHYYAKNFKKNVTEEFGFFHYNLPNAYLYVEKRCDEFIEIGGTKIADFESYLLKEKKLREIQITSRYSSLYDKYLDFGKRSLISRNEFIDIHSDTRKFERSTLNTIDKNLSNIINILNNPQKCDPKLKRDLLLKVQEVFHVDNIKNSQFVYYLFSIFLKSRNLEKFGFEINPNDYLLILRYCLNEDKYDHYHEIANTEVANYIKNIYLRFRNDKKFQERFFEYFPKGFKNITFSFINFCHDAFLDLETINSILGKKIELDDFIFFDKAQRMELLLEAEKKRSQEISELVEENRKKFVEQMEQRRAQARELHEMSRRQHERLNDIFSNGRMDLAKTVSEYDALVLEENKKKWTNKVYNQLREKYPNKDFMDIYNGIVEFISLYERKTGCTFDYQNVSVSFEEIEKFCLLSEAERMAYEDTVSFSISSDTVEKK